MLLLLCDFVWAMTLTGSARSVLLPGTSVHFLALERRSVYLLRKDHTLLPPPAFPLWSDLAVAEKNAKPHDRLELSIGQRWRVNLWVPVLEHLKLSYQWSDGAAVDPVTRRTALELVSSTLRADAVQIVKSKNEARASEEFACSMLNERDFEALADAIESHATGSRKVLWSGVVHAAFALMLASCFVQSLAWLPRWMRSLRRQCPECGRPSA